MQLDNKKGINGYTSKNGTTILSIMIYITAVYVLRVLLTPCVNHRYMILMGFMVFPSSIQRKKI